jgi:hypothetical protein
VAVAELEAELKRSSLSNAQNNDGREPSPFLAKAEATGAVMLERRQRCSKIYDEVKEFKYLRVDRGKPVSEIQLEKPNFLVWRVRENLAEDDRDIFDNPNRWEGSVGLYAYGLLGKEYKRSWTTIRDWVKAWNKSQNATAKRRGGCK